MGMGNGNGDGKWEWGSISKYTECKVEIKRFQYTLVCSNRAKERRKGCLIELTINPSFQSFALYRTPIYSDW